MQLPSFPFQTIDWQSIESEVHEGKEGTAHWKVLQMGDIRVRRVTYSPGYVADGWCGKGHIIYCLEGSMETELKDGRIYTISQGMSYLNGDSNEYHLSSSPNGCMLFIVD